ncbi:MAG: right-handed parallel beta-helix repeat-containing protein [Chitinophagales bacterium]|nr:right-handed parallel beta-helix repeat-containing protein [Chitinophagales bacterium]
MQQRRIKAQNFNCLFQPGTILQDQNASPCNAGTCYREMTNEDILKLPIVEIRVAFHFIASNGNNFQCSNPEIEATYAPTVINKLLDGANTLLTSPAKNEFGNSPIVPDTRIRLVLLNGNADPCSSFFFYPSQGNLSYQNNALDIIVYDHPTAIGISGQVNINNHIELYNLYSLNNINPAGWGKVLIHEIGHFTGLCHAFSPENLCPDMDVAAECGGGTATECNGTPCTQIPPLQCGNNACFHCFCNNTIGNNFMGYHDLAAITRSQWANMYNYFISASASLIAFSNGEIDCSPSNLPPLEIPSNTIVEWNAIKILDRTVEILPGATLIINCDVYIAENQSIIVNRGARLFVFGNISSTSKSCRWAGIQVHGNSKKEQPDPGLAVNVNNPIPIDGAGFVYVNGATISNAITAISTRASGGLGDDYFGGLVKISSGSKFYNNGRAIEFMRYTFENKSEITGTVIRKTNDAPPGFGSTRGVSIWACKGIRFNDVHFFDLKEYGIYGENYSFEVENCEFNNCEYGIRSLATMPNAVEGKTWIKNSYFKNNNLRHINFASTPNLIYPVEISETNQFDNVKSGIGVFMDGESKYKIEGNIFSSNAPFSLLLRSTGTLNNQVSCNIFNQNTIYNFYIEFNNSNLVFPGNIFIQNSRNITLAGNSSFKGEVFQSQGNLFEASSNCFDGNLGNAIRANMNSTQPFTYYRILNADLCKVPSNNLSDGGINNYSVFDRAFLEYNCNNGQNTPNENLNDLTLIRQKIDSLNFDFQNQPLDNNIKQNLNELKYQKNNIIDTLIRTYSDNQDWTSYEQLLDEDTDINYKRQLIGHYVRRKEYNNAHQLLQQIDDNSEESLWFKTIIESNIELQENYTNPQISPLQESILQQASNAIHSPLHAYACALLERIKGQLCNVATDVKEDTDDRYFSAIQSQKKGFIISPNPSDGDIMVNCKDCPSDQQNHLIISTISGRLIKDLYFNQSMQLHLEAPGVYLFTIISATGQQENFKVIQTR